jgi:zinc transport system substrate-binding protein
LLRYNSKKEFILKKIVLLVLLVAGIFFGLMILSEKKNEQNDKVILVSIEPLAKIVRMVAPDGYRVETIVPMGMHVHDFEPTLHDKVRASNSKVSFYFGNDLDRWGKGLGITSKPLCDVSEDPHVWLDPVETKNIVLHIVAEMQKGGIVVDKIKVDKVLKELEGFDRDLQGLSEISGKKIFVIHDALFHLSKRYGFHVVSLLKGDSEEPSLGDVSKMVDSIKKDKATVILGDEMLDEKVYDTLTRETGVEKWYFSTMEQSTESYETLMKKNIESLKIGLGK